MPDYYYELLRHLLMFSGEQHCPLRHVLHRVRDLADAGGWAAGDVPGAARMVSQQQPAVLTH